MPDDETIEIVDPVQAAVEHVCTRKSDWDQSMQTKRKTVARLDKRYFNYRKDLAFSDDKATASPRANIGVPLAGETVDTAVARSHDVHLGHRPYGRIVGTEALDDYKATIHQTVTDIQQSRPWFPRQLHRVIRDAVKYGLGVGKMHFKRLRRTVPEPIMLFGMKIGSRMVEKDVIQTPYVEHVPIQDVFFPLDAPSFDEGEGVIHRIRDSMSGLLSAIDGLGAPLYNPAALKKAEGGTSSGEEDENIQTERTTRGIEQGALHKDGRYEVLEYTGRLPLNVARMLVEEQYPDADPYGDWLIAVIDGVDIPLRLEPCPYLTKSRMWIGAKIIDDPGYIWGISLIEAVESLGITIDELYNMVLDNLNFVINKMFYINTLAGIDSSDVVSSPGKVIEGQRPFNEAMGVIEWPDISQSVFILIQNFLHHYKEYTGIQNPILGQVSPGTQTATEIASITSHSATRLGQFDRMLEDTLFRPLFERWVVLNQQFLDQEFVNRMLQNTQPEFPRVAPEDMDGVFDYLFDGASRAESDAMSIGQYLQALQINATQPVPIFDNLYIGRKLAERWRWPNPAEGLNPLYAEQFMMYQKMAALKSMGETAKALTPDQQRAQKQGNPAKQGAAAQPQNVGVKDYRSALAAVKESALPQGLTEGQL